MIDIHCHLLPGVDDGAADEQTAVAMCRLAAEHGTTDLVATPHANHRYEFSPERNQELRRRLQEQVGPSPRLHLGCDFRLSYDNIQAALSEPARFAINGGQYLLVEFSDQVISQGTSAVFASLGEAGLTPIITHPERNPLLRDHRSRLAAWVHRGCLIQVTGHSLLGAFGSRARESAISLINAGLVHLVASDAHDLDKRPPVLTDSYAFVADRWGEELARQLFVDNPRAVIEGRLFAPPRPKVRRKKRWWEVWK
jgi:protein-tyrosine phosphatase